MTSIKTYNTYDTTQHNNNDAHVPQNTRTLNTNRLSPELSALIISVSESFLGCLVLLPPIFGIIFMYYALLITLGYAAVAIIFGFLGSYGVSHRNPIFVKWFYFWKILSLFFIGLITVGTIILIIFNEIPLLVNTWITIVVVVVLGLIFEAWNIFGILWFKPLWDSYRESGLLSKPLSHLDMQFSDSVAPLVEAVSLVIPQPTMGITTTEDPIKKAVRMFNKKPDEGIRYLIDAGVVEPGNNRDIIRFLHTAEDINRTKLGEFLGENKPFNIDILDGFVDFFDFTNLEYDVALREFVSRFRLPGEAQKIDRIMERFAQKFHRSNPRIFPDSDSAYVLAFSLIMLNTDAHNPAIKHKMTKREFVSNNTGIRGKEDIPVSYLETLYDRIVLHEIKMEADGLFARATHKGWMDKRGENGQWQRRWFVLKNNCLYYFNKPADEELQPRAIIPLEGLRVNKLQTATNISNPGASGFNCVFELKDSTLSQPIKSVKITPAGPIEGRHLSFVLMAPTPDEADEWINLIQQQIIGNPIMDLVKRRKAQISNASSPNILSAPAQPAPNSMRKSGGSGSSSPQTNNAVPLTINNNVVKSPSSENNTLPTLDTLVPSTSRAIIVDPLPTSPVNRD